jgi:hypothetical protein
MLKVTHFKTELLYNFPWFFRAIPVIRSMWVEPGGFRQCHTTFFHTGNKCFNLTKDKKYRQILHCVSICHDNSNKCKTNAIGHINQSTAKSCALEAISVSIITISQ